MTIKGQQAPRRHYKTELAKMDAIAKAAERLAGERLTMLAAARHEATYFYRNFIAMTIAALLEAGVLLYLLTTR